MTPAGPDEPDEPPARVYAVRFTPAANDEALDAAALFAQWTASGAPVSERRQRARDWYTGLQQAAGTLATNPARLAVRERESRLLGRPVRALLYRHTPGSRTAAAYHAFYTVRDDSPDGPRMTVIHVRHAARKPLTRAEAREIQAEQSGS